MTAKATFNAGVLAFRDARYNEAVEKFSEAISLGAQSHMLLDSRAAAYEKLGRHKEALLDSRKVIEQFPDLPHGYSRASRLLTSLGNHDKAVALAQKAVAKVKPNDPKSSTMQALLETALLAQHDYEQELKAKECHVTKLPVELLALIFEDLVQQHRTSPAVLAHVCHQWRDLALNMSSLWCRLVLDQKGNKQEARTAFWLRHSRGRIRQLRVTTSKNFIECMDRLAGSTSSHLEEIEFESLNVDSAPLHFRFQADPISFSWKSRAGGPIRRLPFEPQMGPFRISELKIVGVDLYWQIEAQQLENLTTLVVENGNLLVSELLVLLERSPQIQTLEVQTGYESPLPKRGERLVLANLTTLKLLFSTTKFLEFIEVPALQTLQFTGVALGKALQDLSPPQPPLISFSAFQCTKSQDATFPLPDTLQTLRLSSLACDVDKVVDSIAAGKCPRLVELDVSSTAIGSGPIIRLVKARNCREGEDSLTTAKLELLAMDRCDAISAESLPWIRSKVPRWRPPVDMSCSSTLESANTKADGQMTTPQQYLPEVLSSTASSITSTSHHSRSLPKARQAVVDDLKSVEIVPLSSLFDCALPAVRTDEVDGIVAALKQGGTLGSDGWECFKGRNKAPKASDVPRLHQRTNLYGPEHCRGTKDEIFLRFEDIYKAIMVAAAKGNDSLQPGLTLFVHGRENPTKDWPSSTRPDATLHLTESSVPFIPRTGERYRVDHADVATYFQWKKRDGDDNYQDDYTKLIYNVHYRFRSDPCVAHVTGITIENTSTRFWYFDRSVILESQPFDFMAEPEHLIRIFLALSRGTRSELGFDHTVRCVGFYPTKKCVSEAGFQDTTERQYEFEVHDNHDDPNNNSPNRKKSRKYRSVRCIANYGMIGIRGRGTSIYAVRPSDIEDEDAPLQVLKDSWINVDRIVEGRNLEDIHKKLESDPVYQQCLWHLLTPDCYGSVRNEAGARLESVSLSRSADDPSSRHSFVLNNGGGKKRDLDSIHDGSPRAEAKSPSAKFGSRYNARKRCRTVFVEGPGKELGQLETLEQVFTAIKGGLNAMLAMYRAGYIHRDLSAGNIILLPRKNSHSGTDEKIGVLIDLEYAKKFPDDAIRPPEGPWLQAPARTFRGTWDFMSSEVRSERYHYSKRRNLDDESVPWFRNPIHDVESCWLIACWIFFHFKHPKPLAEHAEDRNYLFGILRPPLGTTDVPLSRVPRDIIPDLVAWAESIGEEYRKLQLNRGDQEKIASFDYEPIIRAAIRYVDSIIRVSMENHSTSWQLHPRQQDVDPRPAKRIKIDEPGSGGT